MFLLIGSHAYQIGSLIEDCLYGWITNCSVYTIFHSDCKDVVAIGDGQQNSYVDSKEFIRINYSYE